MIGLRAGWWDINGAKHLPRDITSCRGVPELPGNFFGLRRNDVRLFAGQQLRQLGEVHRMS
jgi:hypothetical protein